jgi:outer membrane protein assembly factor BamA
VQRKFNASSRSSRSFFAASWFKARRQAPEKITEIRVHGNHTTPDADVLALSGLDPGAEVNEARLKEAEQKLKSAHRFEGVELRKRYLSITDPSQVLVMIVVDEHPAGQHVGPDAGPVQEIPRHADVDADPETRRRLRLHLRRAPRLQRLAR